MNNRAGWEYNKDQDAWLYGEENKGIGAFYDDGFWHANVVNFDIVLLGPYSSLEEAQTAGEQSLELWIKRDEGVDDA